MIEALIQDYPAAYAQIMRATKAFGFLMGSEVSTCALLKTLAASKPGGRFLELGTGTGLATAWILDGMDSKARLVSIDNDENLLSIARENLGVDKRLTLLLTDAGEWIKKNKKREFSFIFADTWPGKYQLIDETMELLEEGGFYIIDDMLPQPGWPAGHAEKVSSLLTALDARNDLVLTRMGWASGIVIAVKTGKKEP